MLNLESGGMPEGTVDLGQKLAELVRAAAVLRDAAIMLNNGLR